MVRNARLNEKLKISKMIKGKKSKIGNTKPNIKQKSN